MKFDIKNKLDYEQSWLDLLNSIFIRLETQWHHVFIIGLIAILCGGITFWFTCLGISPAFYKDALYMLLTVLASILGFGIGCYTLFSAIGNQDYIRALLSFPSKNNSEMPLFKVHMLVIAKFIIVSAFCSLYCLLFYWFELLQSDPKGLEVVNELLTEMDRTLWFSHSLIDFVATINFLPGFLFGIMFGAVLIETKCFIFNIYSQGLTHAVWWAVMSKQNEVD